MYVYQKKELIKQLIFENRPFTDHIGIPIRNYTNQYFANIYLNELDQFIKRKLHIKEYVIYMDDFIFLLPNKDLCIEIKNKIDVFLRKKLHLQFDNF